MKKIFLNGWSISQDFLKAYDPAFKGMQIIDATNLFPDYNSATLPFTEISKKIENLLTDPNSPLDVIGWSLGGLLAQIFVANTTKQVNSLSLINSTADFLAHSESRLLALDKLITGLESDTEAQTLTLKKFYFSLIKEKGEYKCDKPSLETLMEQSKSFSSLELISSLKFLKTTTTNEILKDIKIPTKIIAARLDELIPIDHSKNLSRSIKNSILEIKNNQSHFLPLQIPDFLSDL